MQVIAAMAPSEGRTGELEIIRGEQQPLHTATGFVIGGMMSGLFWLLAGLALWMLM
jgi:hypothetical protein